MVTSNLGMQLLIAILLPDKVFIVILSRFVEPEKKKIKEKEKQEKKNDEEKKKEN